ncbi:head completion/stabilization protein [Sphingomonas melonis]|uniref:head completion/stabilization protein n=1 Tax=Sphingomonas melonis TaxID=152682 RepID=UPI000BE26F88|nr:head completion/stabilization protein [Sphingomonas melonis]ATI54510.1 head completion/stabilization protein [Sphingomonas melonis]
MTEFALPIVDNGDSPAPAPLIANDGFFPDIDPAHFAQAMSVRDSVTPPRRRQALIEGIIAIGNQLAAYREARVLGGIARLADVASPSIDGESRLVQLYRTAVYSTAKAQLVERYRDVDITKAGKDKVEDLEPSIGELRRDAIYAVRDILGTGRTDVELI